MAARRAKANSCQRTSSSASRTSAARLGVASTRQAALTTRLRSEQLAGALRAAAQRVSAYAASEMLLVQMVSRRVRPTTAALLAATIRYRVERLGRSIRGHASVVASVGDCTWHLGRGRRASGVRSTTFMRWGGKGRELGGDACCRTRPGSCPRGLGALRHGCALRGRAWATADASITALCGGDHCIPTQDPIRTPDLDSAERSTVCGAASRSVAGSHPRPCPSDTYRRPGPVRHRCRGAGSGPPVPVCEHAQPVSRDAHASAYCEPVGPCVVRSDYM